MLWCVIDKIITETNSKEVKKVRERKTFTQTRFFHKISWREIKDHPKTSKGGFERVEKSFEPTVTHPLVGWRLLRRLLSWSATEHVSERIPQLQQIVQSIRLLLRCHALVSCSKQVDNVARWRWRRCQERICSVCWRSKLWLWNVILLEKV